jgi:glycosyltransferase involved in cell wall biosynthesis
MASDIETSSRPALSIIIAVYRQAAFLEKIFLSLLNQTFTDFEVVIADDGSGDEIKKVIAAFEGRFKHPIQHAWHEDQGFRKTIIVNRAASKARAPYLVFIDGDCILHHRFLERHNSRKKARQVLSGRRVCLSPEITSKITPLDIQSRRIEKIRFWWNNSISATRRHGFFLPAIFGIKNIRRTRYEILGCNFSVYKEDFLAINGYDERIIGRGLEDSNLYRRFVKNGMTLRNISTEALQYHLYHSFDPIPHSKEVIEQFLNPATARTPFGIEREDSHETA